MPKSESARTPMGKWSQNRLQGHENVWGKGILRHWIRVLGWGISHYFLIGFGKIWTHCLETHKTIAHYPSISSIARFWRIHVGEELELGPETGPFQ